MRHRIAHKHFNRDSNHRKALLKNLVRALVVEGEVTTTVTKAKEVKRLSDRIIHKAQTDTVAMRRVLHRFFGRRDAVNTLVERIAPAMSDRKSGFTSIKKAGLRRGDNAALATVSLVVKPAGMGTLKSGKVYAEKSAKPAVKVAKVAEAKVEKKATPVAKKTAVKASPKVKKAATSKK